ncbi:aminotransferase class I/II-fold pyridoxal phosphate-dependent enzyme [Acidobacteriota bacterium]
MYVMESPPGPKTIINGKEVDYFCGCGYLNLQSHPDVIAAACDAVKKYGIGSATSRAGHGSNPPLLDVEEKASNFFGTETALYFVSGYLGNSILLQGLRESYDVIFIDEQSHYSVSDGASLSNKPCVSFAHCDPEDLKNKIRDNLPPGQIPLVICDGVFPISGEISPLSDYSTVLESYEKSLLCVDDAHATGILGEQGRGTFEHFGITGNNFHFSGTLSKAMGAFGGIIPGEKKFVEGLQNNSMIPFASSAPPTPAAAAAAKSFEILLREPQMRQRLWSNVKLAKQGLRQLGFDIVDNPVPIICLHGDGMDLKKLEQRLFEENLAVLYVRGGGYSSVPPGGAIRIAIFSSHSKDQIKRLISKIAESV